MNTSDTLAALLGCVRGEYSDEHGAYPGGERLVAQPGISMTADWCEHCDGGCGMLYVRLDTSVPSTTFPNPDRTVQNPLAPLAITWHVGVIRGIHGLTKTGKPPDALTQTEDTAGFLVDHDRLLKALRCCLRDSFGRGDLILGAWTPTGPSGDCAGGYWSLTTRVVV